MATTAEDDLHLQRALRLAEGGWGRVHPNPLVGAVVVRGGMVVGEGFHAEYGGPHAEVVALEGAGPAARGATLYVTLEPCAHHGKTPPCTEAILEAGLARVVFGANDPTAAAGGADRLRRAGVAVEGPAAEAAVRRQNAAFFHAAAGGLPWLALKYALSLDARLAARAGEATPISGASAREEVHRLRAGFDAILVGSGTVRVDDPLLTVRGPVAPRRPPIRVVVDRRASLPPGARLLASAEQAPVWVFVSKEAYAARHGALESAGARVLAAPEAAGGLDLESVLTTLRREGVASVLCEGGGRLGAALLAADRVERLYLFLAPLLLGEQGVPAFPGRFPSGASWERWGLRELEGDTLLILDRRREEG